CLHQVDVNTIRTIFGKCDENIFLAVGSSKANWTQSVISAKSFATHLMRSYEGLGMLAPDSGHAIEVKCVRSKSVFWPSPFERLIYSQGISAQGAEILEFALTKVNLRGPNKRRMDGPTTLLYRSIVVTIH
uniref:Uncharacterized protein n=1 Tax=Glossina palpalis gambiensis TaxID=67801 RepID=A0A1B0ALI9_9MUSC